jgi:hypothetical protein
VLVAVSDPAATGRSHHAVAHAVVLALAAPENPLSEQEGLKWNDETGLKLAQRLQPGVVYLSADYERTLWRYYRRLWVEHPLEMFAIYRAKFAVAGRGLPAQMSQTLARPWVPQRAIAWIARQTLSGVPLILLTLMSVVIGLVVYRISGSIVAFAWALLGIAALGTLFESGLILPDFYVFYHGILLLFVLLLPVAAAQILVDWNAMGVDAAGRPLTCAAYSVAFTRWRRARARTSSRACAIAWRIAVRTAAASGHRRTGDACSDTGGSRSSISRTPRRSRCRTCRGR